MCKNQTQIQKILVIPQMEEKRLNTHLIMKIY